MFGEWPPMKFEFVSESERLASRKRLWALRTSKNRKNGLVIFINYVECLRKMLGYEAGFESSMPQQKIHTP